MSGNALSDIAIRKGRSSCQKKIRDATQTIDVGTRISSVAVDSLFGRQIVGRAQYVFGIGDRQ